MKKFNLPENVSNLYRTDNPFRATNGETIYTNAVYMGFSLPKSVKPEEFDPTRHNVVQHFWNPEKNCEYLPITRPYQSRCFIPEVGQVVNVGWRNTTWSDGSVHLQYFCEAVL